MKNIIATTLTTMITYYVAFLFLLLCWMETHRYVYLIWTVALGVPAFKTDPQN